MTGWQEVSNLQANSYVNRRTEDEINDVLNRSGEQVESGTTKYQGKTFEEGVTIALSWVFGMSNEHPADG